MSAYHGLYRLSIIIYRNTIKSYCEAINKKVVALHRTKIGNIQVKDLKIGTWRYLTNKEIENLLK